MFLELSTVLQIAFGINVGLRQDGYIRNMFLGKYIKNKNIVESIEKEAEKIENLLRETEKKKLNVDEHKFKLIALTNDLNKLKKNETDIQNNFIPNIVEKNKEAINSTIIFILTILIWGALENIKEIKINNSFIKIINISWLSFSIFIFIFNLYYFFIKSYFKKNFFIKKVDIIDLFSVIFLSIFLSTFIYLSFLNIDMINKYFFIYKLFIIINSFLPYLLLIIKIINNRDQAEYELKQFKIILEKFHVETRNFILNDFLT